MLPSAAAQFQVVSMLADSELVWRPCVGRLGSLLPQLQGGTLTSRVAY
jgi:hypothetical protein